ncbi:hypothetical protein MJO29_012400 [Puccinia striiformis f. sp. tritici]|nr:hypothetical protein MJO29_012400 [Puccinia striiformis f. sp. tritici]
MSTKIRLDRPRILFKHYLGPVRTPLLATITIQAVRLNPGLRVFFLTLAALNHHKLMNGNDLANILPHSQLLSKENQKNRKRNERTPAASNDCYEHVWLGQLAKKKLGLRPDSPVTLAILMNLYGGCLRGVALQDSIPTSSVRANILPASESQKIRRHEFGINFEQDIQSFTCRNKHHTICGWPLNDGLVYFVVDSLSDHHLDPDRHLDSDPHHSYHSHRHPDSDH